MFGIKETLAEARVAMAEAPRQAVNIAVMAFIISTVALIISAVAISAVMGGE